MVSVPEWKKHYRVIHSRFPPINLFDEDREGDALLLAELEGETSDRLTRWNEFVREEDYRSGSGWGAVMAAFCYTNNGRFSIEDRLGAYYCANSDITAIAEWSYHAAKVWRDIRYTDEASATVRCLVGSLTEPLVDARKNSRVHKKTDYSASQAFALKHYQAQDFGILYRSLRNPGGECAALLRPCATTPVKQGAHYSITWDGSKFTQYALVGPFKPLP